MLLTLIMFLCALYLRRQKEIWLMLAAFAAGAMAAGKYPLIFFFSIPVSALLLNSGAKKRKFLQVCMLGAVAGIGFILFSPSALLSPRFLIESALGGISGYMTGGNSEGFSTPPETFFSVLMYYLFYSDIPLAPLFAVISVIKLNREGRKSAEEKLFGIVIPAAALIFLTYNIFIKTFFMRTVSQFYFIALLYAASGIGRLKKGSVLRAAAFALCALMAVRGAYFVYILSEKGEEKYTAAKLMEKVKDAEVDKALLLGSIFYERGFAPESLTDNVSKIGTENLYNGDYPELEPGMLIVTSSLEHGMAKKCFFPPEEPIIEKITEGWEKFKADNAEYYLGSVYPEYIYKLFGFWVHGSTATNYEFPTNWLYYRPAE